MCVQWTEDDFSVSQYLRERERERGGERERVREGEGRTDREREGERKLTLLMKRDKCLRALSDRPVLILSCPTLYMVRNGTIFISDTSN